MINCGVCVVQLGLILLAVIAIFLSWTEATKCLKDKDLPEYPVNVYYCDDEAKPECCEQNSEFTCCEEESEKNISEQAQLWGGIIGVGVLIAMFWICYRKDTYICEGETLGKRFKRMCACCRGKQYKEDKEKLTSDPEKKEEDKRGIDRRDTALTSRDIQPDMSRPSTSAADSPGGADGREHYNIQQDNYDTDSGRGSAASSPHDSPVNFQGHSTLNEPMGAHSYELRSMPSRDLDGQATSGKKNKHGRKKSKKHRSRDTDPDPMADISL